MSIKDLKSIIENKNKEAEAEDTFDPKEQIAEYVLLTNDLYVKVKNAIKELLDDNLVSLKYAPISISEDDLGQYTIDSLQILFAGEKVTFTPVGTMLIGSKGRIDMVGPKGVERFALIRKGVSSPSQLINISVSIGSDKKNEVATKKTISRPTPADWEWKILPNQRVWTKFEEVSDESITKAIMRVING
jgi:hypothetical protein